VQNKITILQPSGGVDIYSGLLNTDKSNNATGMVETRFGFWNARAERYFQQDFGVSHLPILLQPKCP
jgi:hypothetical protein